jgi:hypothetical protein
MGKGVAQGVWPGLSGWERAISHATPTNRSDVDGPRLAAKSPLVVHRVFRQDVISVQGLPISQFHCFADKRGPDWKP